MKNLKQKFIAAILVAIMAMSTFGFFVEATATEDALVINGAEEGLLRCLDIIPENEAVSAKNLTRGELAYIAAKMANLPEYTGKLRFYDVPAEHSYYQEVHALAAAGVVAGDGDGYYRPDEQATELEVFKIFSVILGYKNVGYYESYSKIARSIGLADGISVDGIMTYDEALQIAHNALHLEMMEGIAYGEEVTYKQQAGFYALERYHGLKRQTGIVKGIPGTTITHPDSDIKDGQIVIDGNYFWYDDESLLGKAVVFYIYADGDETKSVRNIKYLYENDELNQVLEIPAESVIGIRDEGFFYWSGNKEKSVRLVSVPDVVYNGVAYPQYTPEELKPNVGNVKLLDNNNDGIYDVILVESYEYAVCQGYNGQKKVIYGMYPEIIIGNSNQDIDYKIKNEKGLIYPEKLKQGDVLAIRASRNPVGRQKIQIDLLSSSTTGMVESLSEKKIKIGGKEYALSAAAVCDSTDNLLDAIRLGETVSIYQHQGAVAVILHAANDGYKFGYLVDATTRQSAFTERLEIQLVDPNRTMHEYTAGKKVMLDEMEFTDANRILTQLENSAALTYHHESTKWKYSQPVRYRLNNDGVLTHLDTLTYNKDVELENSLQYYQGAMSLAYSSNAKSMVTGQTIGFSLPPTDHMFMLADTERGDVKWYQTPTLENAKIYTVEGYTVDPESYVAEYAVFYTEKSLNPPDLAPFHVVTEVGSILDEEGVAKKQLTMIHPDGKKVVYTVDAEMSQIPVAVGDIVRFGASLQNEIYTLEVSFKLADGGKNKRTIFSNGGPFDYGKYSRMSYGTILAAKDGFYNHTTSIKTDAEGVMKKEGLNNYRMTDQNKFCIYEVVNGEPRVTMTDASSVVPYLQDPNANQTAVMITGTATLKLVYIIQQEV